MKLFAFLCLVTLSQAAIEFTRSIAAIGPGDGGTVTLAHGCTQTDKYGSNDCTLDWNSNNTVSLNVTLAQTLTAKSSIEYDLKVGGLPLKGTCVACGADCTFTIPVIKAPVTISLPPCPIAAQKIDLSSAFTIPANPGAVIKIKASGTVTAKDDTGAVILQVTADGSVGPH